MRDAEFFEDAPDTEAKNYAMWCHLLGLSGYIIPLGMIIGPLIMWMVKKDEFPFVDAHGRESMNFQISVLIYLIACIILSFIIIGIFLLPVLGVFHIVFMIIAAIKANNGEQYKYPLTIRFL